MEENRHAYTWPQATATLVRNLKDPWGATAAAPRQSGFFDLLLMRRGPETVRVLVSQFDDSRRPKEEKQAYLDAPNEFGNTGLHWAALGGYLEVVKLLLGSGASPALANDKDYVPLDLASVNSQFEVVEYFLSLSSSIESRNESGLAKEAEGIELDSQPPVGGEV